MARVKVSLPDSFQFYTDLAIRVDNLNYGGHLGNDSVLTIAHEARIRFFQHFGFQEFDIDGLAIVIADAAIEYRAPAFYGEVLRIECAALDPFRKGCDVVYRFSNLESGVEVARVKTGLVFLDHAQQQTVSIPQLFLQRLGLK